MLVNHVSVAYNKNMLNKIKKYTAFFAAIFNITALGFFYFSKQYAATKPDESGAYDGIGWWFALASVLLWIVFVILVAVLALRKK